ncbi:MAG: HAD-IA family hydrolase [Pseudomonadota bacterium]
MDTALLFGSIGVLAETSDLQRRAFNRAFAEAGLDWMWDQKTYRAMLLKAGGRDRIAEFAAARETEVDAAKLHAAKSAHFQALLRTEPVQPRPGVSMAVAEAKVAALVTTTSPGNIDALFYALSNHLKRTDFKSIIDQSQVERGKPAPDAYELALKRLELAPEAAIAIEDNPDGAEAARRAGLRVIAFPGEMHAEHDFGEVSARVTRLSQISDALAA